MTPRSSSPAEPRVRARGLGRTFGARVALRDVDLDLHAGEVLGVVGPNGGGKSTLLMLMAGLLRPTAGSVTVCGLPAHRLAVQRRGQVGLVTAEPGLYPLLTGWENLGWFAGLLDVPADAARPLLEELQLIGLMEERVSGWSSGSRQKLSLVRALLTRPSLLLLDEPTANLDPLAAQVIWQALRERADAGLAVALATHDLNAVAQISDRVAFVQQTVRHVEALPGPRRAPAPGGLLARYQETLGEGAP
ncbi:MAG: ABC transporter ATP-binding protein [Alphaproteobacteria bacterium]|nr:ABC transporter ATP-binding protein [Alphaproteobacteria bacterium]